MLDLGAPIQPADAQQLATLARKNDNPAVEAAEAILQRYTIARLSVDPDGSSRVAPGEAPRTLIEQGWRMFLFRVENNGNKTHNINFSTGWGWNSATPGNMMVGADGMAQRAYLLDTLNKAPLIEKMWLLPQMQGATTLIHDGSQVPVIALSGIQVEYQVLQLFSRDHGRRKANLVLSTFPRNSNGRPGTASKEFEFDCLPTRDIALGVRDVDGRRCVASLTIRDKSGLVYPPLAMRLAPDMYWQEQIYRADGETVRLPDGEYTVESKRGPEYLHTTQTVSIGRTDRIDVKLQRWIDPAQYGWYSGDTHIHAGGCLHYQIPTEGVSPETMIRHIRGEGLYVGDVLSWGPSWYYQKQFFTGHTDSPDATLEHPELQAANNAVWKTQPTPKDDESLLRYDVEVSGFPSSLSGHLVLLRLTEQDYPGTKLIEEWPSWNLPILKWARAQGALGGYAHCGNGMGVDSKELPNYEIPPFNSVGTNEAIVDVTHGYADFLSGCDTRPLSELNAWYHLLNCGFRLGMVGETDFPCISGERPGAGRSYVKLNTPPKGNAGYEAWIEGLRKGRLYFGDGRSHFLEFKVQGLASGENDVILTRGGSMDVRATVAARLEPQPTPQTEAIRTAPSRRWHIENARVGNTREVPVELVVNGIAVEKMNILADGTAHQVRFRTKLARSAWVALRVMPSGHTHPVFVHVARKPIRASKRSAQWCRTCVDKLWEVKSPFMRESERPEAAEAFEHARRAYDQILSECEVE